MADNPFIALRDRAYDLAETGRFKHWDQVASALKAEGFLSVLITELSRDKFAVMMITRSCDQAIQRGGAA